MSQNEKSKACKAYTKAMAEGKGVKAATEVALQVTKIGHAILDLAWYADDRNHTSSRTTEIKVAPEDRGAAALDLRAGDGWEGQYIGDKLSWGRITVALGFFDINNPQSNEGQVRSQFGGTTGLSSEGMRIGRGGRRLNNEPRFYLGNNKVHGVEDAKPRQLDPDAVAAASADYKPKVTALAAARKKAAAKPRKPRTPKA